MIFFKKQLIALQSAYRSNITNILEESKYSGENCSKFPPLLSKSFTEKFVHGGDAFWSEKWPFSSLGEPSTDEKLRGKR